MAASVARNNHNLNLLTALQHRKLYCSLAIQNNLYTTGTLKNVKIIYFLWEKEGLKLTEVIVFHLRVHQEILHSVKCVMCYAQGEKLLCGTGR